MGAYFHLERLNPEHADALDAAADLIWDWQGDFYRSAELSVGAAAEPAKRAHLDYMAGQIGSGLAPKQDMSELQHIANVDTKLLHDDFYVDLASREGSHTAASHSFEFWATLGEITEARDNQLPCYAALTLLLPADSPLEEFEEQVTRLADILPLRWASAGFTYAWSYFYSQPSLAAIYAHARRFAGFDPGFHHRAMSYLHDRIRSVNWLTYVGSSLIREAALQLPPEVSGLQVAQLGNCTKIRAGDAPAAGDANRLQVPEQYRRVDQLLRKVRATGDNILFIGPWSESETEAWLRRFETI